MSKFSQKTLVGAFATASIILVYHFIGEGAALAIIGGWVFAGTIK